MIELPTTRGGFQVIYADPAWAYGNERSRSAARVHYPVVSIRDLKNLPVGDIAAKDAFLFMWATPPMLPLQMEVMAYWGFTFKTVAFWWAKRNQKTNSAFFGMGNYTRANGEPCLLGIRGKPKRVSASVSQFVWSPRRRHSEKPPEIRDLIVKFAGDVRRVELFSRHEVAGWKRWGNELL